jgi:threonine synthase
MGEVVGETLAAGHRLLRYRYGPGLLPDRHGGERTLWRYRELLPIGPGPIRYPLPVGGTPLLPAPALAGRLGVAPGSLWLKDETWGPSASNKDRATALVIEHALRTGMDTVTTASTGNAGVATAVGAAAAALRSVILLPEGCLSSKLALMRLAGARVFRVAGGYAAARALSRAAAARFGWADRNTGTNPFTIEAKKTVAFEIWEQLGRAAPDTVVVPVGDGPTLVGMAKGFRELVACGAIAHPPRLVGVQAAACQPLVCAWSGRPAAPEQLDPARTTADGIAVVDPASGDLALADVTGSGGAFVAVDDEAIEGAIAALAGSAGVLAEPAGAAAAAGLAAAVAGGLVAAGGTTVVLLTGRELALPTHRGGVAEAPLVAGLDDLEHHLNAPRDPR